MATKQGEHWNGQPSESYLPGEGYTTPQIRDLILGYVRSNGPVTTNQVIRHIELNIAGPKPLRAGVISLAESLCDEGDMKYENGKFEINKAHSL